MEIWERTVLISEKLSFDDVYSYQMLHVPHVTWNLTADGMLHESPTIERATYIRSFFEQRLSAFSRSSGVTYIVKPAPKRLMESSLPGANGLCSDMVLVLFNPRHPWESLEATAAVGPMTATGEEKYLTQIKEIPSAEQPRLFQVILRAFRLEAKHDPVLVNYGDAVMLDHDQS